MMQWKTVLAAVLVFSACAAEGPGVEPPNADRTGSVQVLGGTETNRDVGRLVAAVDDAGTYLSDGGVEAVDEPLDLDAGVDAAPDANAEVDPQLIEFCTPFVGQWEWIMSHGLTQCDGSPPPDPPDAIGGLLCDPYCQWMENLWITETCDVFAENELTQERTLVYTGARLEDSVLHLQSAQQDDPEAKRLEMEYKGVDLDQFLGTYTRPNSDCPDQVLSLQVRRVQVL